MSETVGPGHAGFLVKYEMSTEVVLLVLFKNHYSKHDVALWNGVAIEVLVRAFFSDKMCNSRDAVDTNTRIILESALRCPAPWHWQPGADSAKVVVKPLFSVTQLVGRCV